MNLWQHRFKTAFSELAYLKLETFVGRSISSDAVFLQIKEDLPKDLPTVQSIVHETMGNWVIASVSGVSTSGFYGVAFKNDVTGETKFAFRGSDTAVDVIGDAQKETRNTENYIQK